MRGYERQEAGVPPSVMLEEGFREGWARVHPDKPVPEEVIRLFAAWGAKVANPYQPEPVRGRPVPKPEPPDEDDFDPFGDEPAPAQADSARVAELEREVRDRMAAAAAKREAADPTLAFFAGVGR